MHRGHDFASVAGRVDVSSVGIDPVASGVSLLAGGGPDGGVLWLFAGASTRFFEASDWTVKRPGRLWRYHHAIYGDLVVRAARKHLVVRARIPLAGVPDLVTSRFVAIGFGVVGSLRPCAEIDVSAPSCRARKHTTVCR
jgi:hypothetical protein